MINGYGKATLPSVDSGLGSMNIIKEPSKSIHTRRINKVGDTDEITKMIDDSTDRACEAIQVYARGVNPMVSVMYTNSGGRTENNGGLQIGGPKQGRLPYALSEAFRPPVLRQENLYPLSRLPRNVTSVASKPGFADFSKKLSCEAPSKTIRTDTIKTFIRPTATYNIAQSITEPFEVKYVIQPVLQKSANTNIKGTDITQQNVQVPTGSVNDNILHANGFTNKNIIGKNIDYNFDTTKYIQDTNAHEVYTNKQAPIQQTSVSEFIDNFNTTKYIQDTNAHEVYTNKQAPIQQTSISEVFGNLDDIKTKNVLYTDYITNKNGHQKVTYLHNDLSLERNLPHYNTRTNIGQNIYKQNHYDNEIILERNTPLTHFKTNIVGKSEEKIGSRDYKLPPKLQPGQFLNSGQIPTIQQHNIPATLESQRNQLGKTASNIFFDRYNTPIPTN
jgi:hypothetical protein